MGSLRKGSKTTIKAVKLFVILSLSLVLTFSSAFAFSGLGDDRMQKATADSAGEGIVIDNLTFRITEINTSDHNAYGYAPKGYKYMYIYLNATNNGAVQVGMTANMIFKLSDSHGKVYSICMPEEPGSFNGLIDPNGTLYGKICFLVPSAENTFTLTIKPFTYDSSYAKVSIVNNQWSVITTTAANTAAASTTTYQQLTCADIGRPIIVNNISFTVNNVYVQDRDPYRIPASGNDILYFDMTVKNLGQVQYGLTSNMVFKLRDNTGKIYNIITPEGTNSLNGLINYNQSITGVVRFEVPKNVNEFYLIIKPFNMYPQTAEVMVNR